MNAAVAFLVGSASGPVGYPTAIDPAAVPIKVNVPCITCDRALACEYTPKNGEAAVVKYGACMCSWDEHTDALMDNAIRDAALEKAFNAGIDACHRILDRKAAR